MTGLAFLVSRQIGYFMIKFYKKVNCPECSASVNTINGERYPVIGHINGCSLAGQKVETKGRIDSLYDSTIDGVPYYSGGIYPDGTRIPYRYQTKGIEFAKGKDSFALFWQMRLGKTLTTIKIGKEKNWEKVLIVCPKSVINTWMRELKLEKQAVLRLTTVSLKHTAVKRSLKFMPGWFVTNYETLIKENLAELADWDALILDESEKIKDPTTKISRELAGGYFKKIIEQPDRDDKEVKIYRDRWRKVKNKVCLTGTPAPENLLNYFQQLKFLFGSFAGTDNYQTFKSKYFTMIGPNKFTVSPHVSQFLSATLAEYCFVLQRDQVGIGSTKVFEERETELSSEYREVYDSFERDWITEDGELQVACAIAAYTDLHQLSGGYHHKMVEEGITSPHKLNELKQILKNDLRGERVLIWFRFKEEIKQVTKVLPVDSWAIWSGDTKTDQRLDLEEQFAWRNRSKPLNGKVRKQYLLCQIKSACHGLDFAGADQSIYFSNEPGSKWRQQSEDRLVHPEKEVPLLYIDLVAENTICPSILAALKGKIEDQQTFLMKIHEDMKERHGV